MSARFSLVSLRFFVRYLPCFGLLFLALTSSRSVQTSDQVPPPRNWTQLRAQFAKPSAAYGSGPLFVWNDQMRKGQLDTLLNELHGAGFGGVFVHPRPGLVTEYLSDQWFDLYAHTLKRCQELGMEVWIYDENSYPSGFAGGHVPDQFPESYNEGQGLYFVKANLLPDSVAKAAAILKQAQNGWTDITTQWQQAQGKQGSYAIFWKTVYDKSPWYGGFSYVDLLKPGVTEKFIDVTMTRGYEKRFRNELGKRIRGIFTDEPHIGAPRGNQVRWTPDLFQQFRQRWGYDLQPHLPALWEEVGDWRKVRHNYYQTLLQLFIDRWARPWYTYCEKRNLEWTGHYWEHEWPKPDNGGDNMAMYAWHQRPAIDMLFNQFDEESNHAQFGNIRAVKELGSVANQLGKTRTLSETYGGGGWEDRFQDFKRLGDWEYVLGVNYLNQHLSYATIKGARKYDYPPSFSYHSPWWPYYRQLNDYYRRLSLALSSGYQYNRVLVLEPTTTAWLYYARQGKNETMEAIGLEFQRFVTALEKQQVEYDLGSETIISDHGSVVGRGFRVGQRTYDVVVLPPRLENLDQKTADLLKQYAAAGGNVLDYSQWKRIDGQAVGAEKLAPSAANWRRFDRWATTTLRQQFPNPDWQVEQLSERGKFYHQRRLLEDGQLLFCVNSDLTDSTRCALRVNGKSVYEMDLFTGSIRPFPFRQQADGVRLIVSLPSVGSKLLFISNKSNKTSPVLAKTLRFREVPTPVTVVKPSEANVLTIDFCDVTMGDTTRKDLQVYAATDWVFKRHGLKDGNPWNTSVQYKKNTLAKDTFGPQTGYRATYRFTVEGQQNWQNWEAVIESNDVQKTVRVNGQVVQPKAGSWWLDRSFRVYPIGTAVRAGTNEVEITVSPMRIFAEIEPVYIRGDFGLQSAVKGWTLVPAQPLTLGSWKNQGYPFYSNSVDYTQTYTLTTPQKTTYQLRLDGWAGTTAEVRVNGSSAGLVAFPPYVLTLTNLRSGQNTITVRVVGSNKNLLGPHHKNPAPGLVSPWLFRGVATYPPGNDYQQLDYGLFKPFRLFAAAP
ncbi:alpha-L-rhamnosidase [Spirosoma humi]